MNVSTTKGIPGPENAGAMARRDPRRFGSATGLLIGIGILVATGVSAMVAPSIPLLPTGFDDPALVGAVIVAAYLVRPLLAAPTTLVAAGVGYLLGPAGIPVALCGTVLSSCPPYVAGKRFGSDRGLLGRWRAGGEAFFDVTGELRGVVAARVAPTPSDPTSYALGLTGVRWRPFLAGTAIGELHWTVLAVSAGWSASHLASGVASAGSVAPSIAALGAFAAAALVAGPLYRHLRDGASGVAP